MTVRQKEQIITLAVALAMGAAFLFVLVLPRAKKLQELKLTESTTRHETAAMVEETKQEPKLHQEVQNLERHVDELSARIPQDNHTAMYEQGLWDLGMKYGLCSRDAEPGTTKFFDLLKTRQDGSVIVRGARLSFNSDFPTFFAFLKELEAKEELTEIDRIKIKPMSEGADVFRITVDLSFFYGSLAGA